MKKSILTLVIVATIQMFSFAQQASNSMSMEENFDLVEKRVDEKSDITGTFANTGEWNVFVDDAKVELTTKSVKKISNANMQSLLQEGFEFVKKSKAQFACYRYRIVAEEDGKQTMYLHECDF